jgi:hypothetical protein
VDQAATSAFLPPPGEVRSAWLSQRFSDAAVEAAFRADYAERSLRPLRVGLAVGLAIYAAFGALDAYLIPEALAIALTLRFALVCPMAAGLLAWSLSPTFLRHMQAAGAVLGVVAGAGIVVMIAEATGPGRELYYAGLLLVLAFTYTFLRLRFVAAVTASWIITGAYLATLILDPAPAGAAAVSNVAFLLGFDVIGMSACYTLERSARQEYLQRQVIAAQAASLAEALGNVKVLSGLLPICAWCHKVRHDDGYWQQIEAYLSARTDASFTHGICPDCQHQLESRPS